MYSTYLPNSDNHVTVASCFSLILIMAEEDKILCRWKAEWTSFKYDLNCLFLKLGCRGVGGPDINYPDIFVLRFDLYFGKYGHDIAS